MGGRDVIDGTLHGHDADGTPIEVRARCIDVDAAGRLLVETLEPFVALPTTADPDAHLFEPGVPRWLHPRIFTFDPDEETSHG
jgi:hypothetical protein